MISLKSHGNIINEVNISINTDLSKEKKKKKKITHRWKDYTRWSVSESFVIYVNIGRKSIGTVGVAERSEKTSRQAIGAEPQRDSCLYPRIKSVAPYCMDENCAARGRFQVVEPVRSTPEILPRGSIGPLNPRPSTHSRTFRMEWILLKFLIWNPFECLFTVKSIIQVTQFSIFRWIVSMN